MHAPKRPKVLVVDDEQVIADTLAKILDINGYDASAVYSGCRQRSRAPGTSGPI